MMDKLVFLGKKYVMGLVTVLKLRMGMEERMRTSMTKSREVTTKDQGGNVSVHQNRSPPQQNQSPTARTMSRLIWEGISSS